MRMRGGLVKSLNIRRKHQVVLRRYCQHHANALEPADEAKELPQSLRGNSSNPSSYSKAPLVRVVRLDWVHPSTPDNRVPRGGRSYYH